VVLKLNVSWHSGGLNSPTDVGGLSLSLTIIALVSRGNGFEPGPRCVNTFQFFPSFFCAKIFFLHRFRAKDRSWLGSGGIIFESLYLVVLELNVSWHSCDLI